MKTIIKASRLNLLMVLYRAYDSIMDLILQISNGDTIHAYVVHTVTRLNDDFETLKLNNFEYRLFKTPVEDGFNFDIEVLEEFRDNFRLHFHNHILELFKHFPEMFYEAESDVDLTTIEVFENTTQLRLVGRNDVDANFTEQFFSKCKNLDGAIMESRVKDKLSENSKLTMAKNLYFERSYDQVNIITLHFKGHHAVFEKAQCCNLMLEQVLLKWIAHEAFQELKSLKINQAPGWYFSPLFFDHYIPSKRWEPSRRPENYKNETKIMRYEFESFECADFVDIQRKFDGKLASFKVTPDCFQFCVWD